MSNTLELKVLDHGIGCDGRSTLSFANLDSLLANSKIVMQLTEAVSDHSYGDTYLEIRPDGVFASTPSLAINPDPMDQINSISRLLSAIEMSSASPDAASLSTLSQAMHQISPDAITRFDHALGEVARADRRFIKFEFNGSTAAFNIPHSAHIKSYLDGKALPTLNQSKLEVVILEKLDVHDVSFTDGMAAYLKDEEGLPSLTLGAQLTLDLNQEKQFLVVSDEEDHEDAHFG